MLYHYTSIYHLPHILSAGYLKVCESNISGTRAHAGPDVVWLTTDPDPSESAAHGLDHAQVLHADGTVEDIDKAAVRFTVNVPDAHDWLTWSRRHGITKRWAHALENGRSARAWHVVTRPIPAEQWTAIHVRQDGVMRSLGDD